MRKILLKYDDWKTILLGSTGFPQQEEELYLLMKNLASRSDVAIVLTHDNQQEMVLKYDENEGKFSEYSLNTGGV